MELAFDVKNKEVSTRTAEELRPPTEGLRSGSAFRFVRVKSLSLFHDGPGGVVLV